MTIKTIAHGKRMLDNIHYTFQTVGFKKVWNS